MRIDQLLPSLAAPAPQDPWDLQQQAYMAAHPGYDPSTFNTPLPEDQTTAFLKWKLKLPPGLRDDTDYDLQGAFLDPQARIPASNGHMPDTYKKPNHVTFSTESQYAKGAHAGEAGKWVSPNVMLKPNGELLDGDGNSISMVVHLLNSVLGRGQ
jgi:hypothetical protein